ncbi:MAG: TlpA family protein disulfide reductase [Myxococcota bacterium]
MIPRLALVFAALSCSRSQSPPAPERVPFQPPIASSGAMAPQMTKTSGGLVASWLEPSEHGHSLRVSALEAGGWTAPTTIVSGRPIFANWADVPAVGTGGDGSLVAWWPERVGEGTYAYGVQLARSVDGAQHWANLGSAHDDETETEHGFVSMAPVKAGARVSWLDGRGTEAGGPMTLRSAVVGANVGPSIIVDDRVCDCCGTDSVTVGDATLVVYRDRSADEVRDVVVARIEADGAVRRTPVSVDGWQTGGCPVNGPKAAASGDHVAVAWFTKADGPEVRLAWSLDGGRSFGPPLTLAVAHDGRTPLGRVDLAWLGDDEVAVSWMEQVGERGMIRARRVAGSGRAGTVFDVGETTSDRASGFPSLASADDTLVWLWTVPGAGLQAKRIPAAQLPTVEAALGNPIRRGVEALAGRFPGEYRPDGIEGEPLDFAGLAGHPVLVNLWATWCPPCMVELPELVELHSTWAERGLVVVSVAVDDKPKRVQNVAAANGLTWKHAVDGSGRASRVFGTDQLPSTLLYGRDGKLLWSKQGPLSADEPELEVALKMAVKQPGR